MYQKGKCSRRRFNIIFFFFLMRSVKSTFSPMFYELHGQNSPTITLVFLEVTYGLSCEVVLQCFCVGKELVTADSHFLYYLETLIA